MTLPVRPAKAERAILGIILRDPACLDVLALKLRASHFYEDAHQTIFTVALALREDRKPCDAVSLAEELQKRNQLENIGGANYLQELIDAVPIASEGVAEHFAEHVIDYAKLRALDRAADTIKQYAAHTKNADYAVATSQELLAGIASADLDCPVTWIEKHVNTIFAWADEPPRSPGNLRGLRTGFSDLDKKLAGLHSSEMAVLAARPSMGKTALAGQIAMNVALAGKTVLFCSIEQKGEDIAERMLAALGLIDYSRIRERVLWREDKVKLYEAGTSLRPTKLVFDDKPDQSITRIAATARRTKARHGLGLIVVDYLQLVTPSNRRDPRHEQVAGISRRLKQIARDLDVPMLALAQLSRNVEYRPGERPKLADLRESGGIEADADTVMLLFRPPPEKGFDGKLHLSPLLEIDIAKQRNGPTGTVTLFYRRHQMRFEDYATSTEGVDDGSKVVF